MLLKSITLLITQQLRKTDIIKFDTQKFGYIQNQLPKINNFEFTYMIKTNLLLQTS